MSRQAQEWCKIISDQEKHDHREDIEHDIGRAANQHSARAYRTQYQCSHCDARPPDGTADSECGNRPQSSST